MDEDAASKRGGTEEEEEEEEESHGVKGKFVRFLYGAYLTRSVRVRTRDGQRRRVTDLDCCKQLSWLTTRMISDSYYDLSTATHLVAATFFISFFKLHNSNDDTRNYFLRCYSPRFVMFQYMELKNCAALGAMFSLLHVGYRCLARVRWRDDLEISQISFVLESEREFHHCLELGSSRTSSANERSPEQQQRPMLDIMYYRFRDPISREFQLKLRPNRDLESRRATFKLIDRLFVTTHDWGMLIGAAFWLVGCVSLFAYQRDLYPNCELAGVSAFLFRNLSSIFILFFHALEGFVLLSLTTMAGPLLIYDLDLYLEQLLRRIRKLRLELATAHRRPPPPTARRRDSELDRESDSLERDLADLRASLVDFFALVRQTDKFVSVITPCAMFIWLVCNGFLTLSGMQLAGSLELVFIRLTQCFGFLLSGIISGSVLEFKRRTERAYVALCSLMALDESPNKPTAWIPLMSFYTHKPRYAFTLLGYKIYTRLAYLSYISYTLTFVLFVESVGFVHRRPAS